MAMICSMSCGLSIPPTFSKKVVSIDLLAHLVQMEEKLIFIPLPNCGCIEALIKIYLFDFLSP